MARPKGHAHWDEIEQHWAAYLQLFDEHLHARTRRQANQARRSMRRAYELLRALQPSRGAGDRRDAFLE